MSLLRCAMCRAAEVVTAGCEEDVECPECGDVVCLKCQHAGGRCGECCAGLPSCRCADPDDRYEHQARRRERLRAAGLCPICGQAPPADGLKACDECLEARRQRAKARGDNAVYALERATRLYKAGRCVQCAEPRDDERVRCAACRSVLVVKERHRREELKAAGRCTRCTRPVLYGAYCERCKAAFRSRRRNVDVQA